MGAARRPGHSFSVLKLRKSAGLNGQIVSNLLGGVSMVVIVNIIIVVFRDRPV